MKARIRGSLVLILSILAPCYGQQTLQIEFDGPPLQPPGTAHSVQGYDEAGMSFRPVGPTRPGNTFSRVGSGGPSGQAQNATAYLRAAFTQSLMFSLGNGSVFDLVSVDLAEYSTVVPDPVTVLFVGYLPDGSTVTTSMITDGVIDGPGPLADFETFYVDDRFTGLDHVGIPTYGWSLDNLVVSVPEPTIGALLLLASRGMAFGAPKLVNRLRK